jgi:hypothetical protein
VKVFLLSLDPGQPFFHSEDGRDEEATPSVSARPGMAGWFRRTTRRMKSAVKHPKSRLARKLKQFWDWLQSRMYPDESLLAALRSARTIELHHPESLSSDEALGLWEAYLRRRFRRHFLWLLFDLFFSPLSILLTPLPGPNVIGYWFAYRAVHHLLILLGIRRALRGRVETIPRPIADLDATGGPGDKEWLTRTAAQYELKGLHDFVARMAPGPAALSGAEATRETQRSCDC